MTTLDLRPGDVVRLATPHNPRLDGALATVTEPAEWGAHVATAAAATGQYRAAWCDLVFVARPAPADPVTAEMAAAYLAATDPEPRRRPPRRVVAREAGYSGEECGQCGAMRMRRNGSCLVCDSCGTTSGCS